MKLLHAIVLTIILLTGVINIIGQSNEFPYIHQIEYSMDKTRVAITTQEGISIYDDSMNELSFLAFVSGTEFEDIPYISLNSDGHKLYVGSNAYMQILDTTSFDVLLEFEDENIVFYTPQWNSDSTKIAFRTNQEHATSIYSALDGSLLTVFDSGVWQAGNIPVWSPNEQYFATTTRYTVYILDATTGTEITHHQFNDTEIGNVVWSPDSSSLAITTSTLVPIGTPNSFPLESAPGFSLHSTVLVIDAISGTVLTTIDGLRDPLRYLQWSPDGSQLAGNDTFRTLYVWDATTGELIDSYLLQPFSLDALEYSVYGGRIILGYSKGFFSFPAQREDSTFSPISTFAQTQLNGSIQFVAPTASSSQLATILSQCVTDSETLAIGNSLVEVNQYSAFVEWLEQQSDGLVPQPCANDLHLIAETLVHTTPALSPITSTTDTTPTFTWSAVSGTESYLLSVSSTSTSTQESFVATNICDSSECSGTLSQPLTPDTYSASVQGSNATVTSEWSNVITFDVLQDCDYAVPAGDTTGLISAINSANANADATSICLEGGTYSFTSANSASNALPVITTDVTILGNGAILENGSTNRFRIFYVDTGGTLTLEDMTITGGDLSNEKPGAGLYFVNASGTLRNTNVLLNYTTDNGGGIWASNSNLTLIDSVVNQNSAAIGNERSPR